MREITINQNDAGQRLDKFLTKYLVNMPQSMLYKSLRKNCVRVNGKHIKDGKYMLQNGDVLKLSHLVMVSTRNSLSEIT